MFHRATLTEILEERASRSLNRVCPRGVKRKMSSYQLRPRIRAKTIRINFRVAIQIVK